MKRTEWELFHRLWTKAAAGPRYDKSEWMAIEAMLLRDEAMIRQLKREAAA